MDIQKDHVCLVCPSALQVPDEDLDSLVEEPWIGKATGVCDPESGMVHVEWLYPSRNGLTGKNVCYCNASCISPGVM